MGDMFAERMAAVRGHFAAGLQERIDQIESTTQRRGEEGDLEALAVAHRNAHGMCGVGSTLGFVGTGKVAREIEQVLLTALRANRDLSDDEVPRLRERIALLRATAAAEMGSGD